MQPYTTVHALCERHHLKLPRPHPWWLLSGDDCIVGEVNGVPTIRGKAVATNGIMVAVLTVQGDIDLGHRQFFVRDEEPREESYTPRQASLGTKRKATIQRFV